MDEEQLKQYQNAKRFIERLLAQYPRTIWEIKTKLAQKKFAPKIIEQVIKEFVDAGFLNDEKYIRLWLENQIKYRPCGRLLCFKKLQTKGLGYELIKNILEKEYPPEKEEQVAEELAKWKMKSLLNFSDDKKVQKIASFLRSKGFNDNVIINVLEKLKLRIIS